MRRSSGKRKSPGKAVDPVFRAYPAPVRAKLTRLRGIILNTAKKLGVGPMEETLRWGQPSYIVEGGSTIRIDAVKSEPGRYAMYFICHTDLIARFREHYPNLDYGGKRAILFDVKDKLPEDALRHCISMALTYHAK